MAKIVSLKSRLGVDLAQICDSKFPPERRQEKQRRSEDTSGFLDCALFRGNSAQVEASLSGFVLCTNLVIRHLWIPPLPQRARQGWGTQFVVGIDKDRKIGGPPANLSY
jgi:hypothetical protein